MNVVLLVVDSLRARSLDRRREPGAPATPFLDRLAGETIHFRRAYAAECWTLPAHLSMFTGLLPSAHGAHFRSMAYAGSAPTIAEELAAAGFHTEVVTRNSIFDGSLPGVTRGFQHNTRIVSALSGLNPLAIMLAASKPRFRRQIRTSGFFHPLQRERREFVKGFARATIPADAQALAHALERMRDLRRAGRPYFLFLNLYDVHAPYPPSPSSIFHPPWRPSGWLDTLVMPAVLPRLGGHQYLEPGFALSPTSRRLLLARYHRAIALMDAKLARFYDDARRTGLLDDTLLVVTSDHGEGFGEHGLYLHDSSVHETHLHVPLFVHHPGRSPAVVDDVVSTRGFRDLFRAAALGPDLGGTLLDPAHRASRPIVLAEHLHYPHVPRARPEFRQDLAAAIVDGAKVVVRNDGAWHYDLRRDPDELAPVRAPLGEFAATCRRLGVGTEAIDAAVRGLGVAA